MIATIATSGTTSSTRIGDRGVAVGGCASGVGLYGNGAGKDNLPDRAHRLAVLNVPHPAKIGDGDGVHHQQGQDPEALVGPTLKSHGGLRVGMT